MKSTPYKRKELEDSEIRAEYDFRGGVRGKHSKAMQAGYTITIHQMDGTTVVKDVKSREGLVILEPDVRAYFPDSESVNKTLRSLITLIPAEPRAKRTTRIGTASGRRSKTSDSKRK